MAKGKIVFKKEPELDAQMLFAYRQGNNYEIMNFRFKNSRMFKNDEMIEARMDWFLKQDEEYILIVNKMANK